MNVAALSAIWGRRKFLALSVLAVTLAIALTVTLAMPGIYRSTATVLVAWPEDGDSPRALGDVVNTTTCAPNARANFTPMCPRPPSPTTPTFFPLVTFQWRIGE